MGANQRKASSGNVTPRATPTSTSVRASAPRAMRLSPASATSPVTTHLPLFRQRPSGTRVYRIATSPAAKSMTCSDGMAQPPQSIRISTPNGRGRWAIAASTAPITCTNEATITQTIRCRKRRSTTSASTSPHTSPSRAHHELRAASPRQMPTSPGAWSPPSHLTAASSATVTSTATPRSPPAKATIVSATSTSAAISHRTPLVCT